MLRLWPALLSISAVVAGCGTDAVGVSDCRAIERARCDAAVACGFPDAEECRRLQRDQCLHGVAVEDVSSSQVDACVRDIERAGTCAAAQGPGTAAGTCSEPIATDVPTRSACDVVESPELAGSCTFLVPGSPASPAAPPAPAAPTADGGA